MDFYVVLGRAGFDIGKRKHKKAHMGASHKISKDEAIKWFQQTYDGVILPGECRDSCHRVLYACALLVSIRRQSQEIQRSSTKAWQEEINLDCFCSMLLLLITREEQRCREKKKNKLSSKIVTHTHTRRNVFSFSRYDLR